MFRYIFVNFPADLLNLHTFYFRQTDCQRKNIINPPDWGRQTVSAHANAYETAEFFRYRDENLPGDLRYFSYIECIEDNNNTDLNDRTCWNREKNIAYFGQEQFVSNENGTLSELCCTAVAKDIVAHEFTHAVIYWMRRQIQEEGAIIIYKNETGALYESYADIFAILVKNYQIRNINEWNWEIGSGFGDGCRAIRNFQQPETCFTTLQDGSNIIHPRNMRSYVKLPDTNNSGNHHDRTIHINCNIHNHAIYQLLSNSRFLRIQNNIDIDKTADFFYKVLYKLTPEATFYDSYLRMISEARKFNIPREIITQAFDEVGIAGEQRMLQ